MRRRSFRHVLLSAKTHVFAITARDGSRQYVYCRPLSNLHALILLSTVSHTALYVSALERTAARYALLVDEIQDAHSLSNSSADIDVGSLIHTSATAGVLTSVQRRSINFLKFEIFRCPPQVAKELVRSLLDWLDGTSFTTDRKGLAADDVLKRTQHRIWGQHRDCNRDLELSTDIDCNSATWLTSSTTSSGLSSGPKDDVSQHMNSVQETTVAKESVRFFSKRDGDPSASDFMSQSKCSLPWEDAANDSEADSSIITRILELTDATLLFRYLSVRAIMSIVVALLEERRVCIIGPSTAVVSRAVLAFDNLLRPFEWPHLISPILLEHLLPVLGAPFPFLVGIHSAHVKQTNEIPMDGVVFADLEKGKVWATEDIGDLFKRVPRRVRYRFERRLARTKNACMRQVSRSLSSPFVPTVSNTATSYFEEMPFHQGVDKSKPSLFRSKSLLKLAGEAAAQNIWLERQTVSGLDRSVRKFFAELLEDLPQSRAEDSSQNNATTLDGVLKRSTPAAGNMSFTSGKREAERYQLACMFRDTQMFMQWDSCKHADRSFGIIPSDVSLRKKRSSIYVHSLCRQRKKEWKSTTKRIRSPV